MSADSTSESLDEMRARNAAAPVSLEEMLALNRNVIEEFRANDGKVSGMFAKEPLLLLTTTGAKTGETRTNPLVHTLDGDRVVIIASFGGAPKHPAWFLNIRANPEVTIELPDELAEEARSQGLFAAGAVEAMIRETLRRRAAKELLEAADKLAAAEFPPLTLAEIQEEVNAVRAERRRRETGA